MTGQKAINKKLSQSDAIDSIVMLVKKRGRLSNRPKGRIFTIYKLK
jgi:hypothetical protein